MSIKQFNPMHPGQFIKEVYLEPFRITNTELASKLDVDTSTVSRMVKGFINVMPLMALKLSKVLGRSPESWLLMQSNYNLYQVKQAADLSACEQIKFVV